MTEEHKQYLNQVRKQLYKQYCNPDDKYYSHNADLVDYVISNVLSRQVLQQNPAELEALEILKNRGMDVKYQEPIPILSEGGKLEHLYIADIVIGKTIVEIDGSFHEDMERQARDIYRDEQTQKAGYVTKRYLPYEVERLKDEKFN